MPKKLMHLDHSPRPSVRSRGIPNKLIFLFSATLLLAMPTFAQQSYLIETGLPIDFSTLNLHQQGQPVNVDLIVVSLYPMNTPPPWPVGLWLFMYVEAGAGGGANKSNWSQSQWCQWWFNQVAQLETQDSQQIPFPYLQVNLPAGVAQIQTDEGIPIYPAGSVTCWQANNGFPAP